MLNCPHCKKSDAQVKAGLNQSGSQRVLCKHCLRKYTPEPNDVGLPMELRQQALEMYVDGSNFRAIARRLKVNHQTVINWVNAQANLTPGKPPIADGPIETAELDELFTFIGEKKNAHTS